MVSYIDRKHGNSNYSNINKHTVAIVNKYYVHFIVPTHFYSPYIISFEESSAGKKERYEDSLILEDDSIDLSQPNVSTPPQHSTSNNDRTQSSHALDEVSIKTEQLKDTNEYSAAANFSNLSSSERFDIPGFQSEPFVAIGSQDSIPSAGYLKSPSANADTDASQIPSQAVFPQMTTEPVANTSSSTADTSLDATATVSAFIV